MSNSLTLEVTLNPKDMDRVTKRLAKWQGTPLAVRTAKAEQAGLKLLVGPIRAASPKPGQERPPEDATGQLAASVAVWKLPNKGSEVAAYAVGPRGGRSKRLRTAPHRHLVIRGHKMVTHRNEGHRQVGVVKADPFVGRAADPLVPQVIALVDRTVRSLA